MKPLFFLLLLFLCISCNNQTGKTDAALIKTLNKAITILEEKNEEHFKKLESNFKDDSTDTELQKLYQQFSQIQRAKKKFKEVILKEEDLKPISTEFVTTCFEQLDESEKEKIRKNFDQSLLLNPETIEETDRKEVLRYELILEAEELEREIQLILLKDLNKRKPSFDWKYYWEK
jgi:hypothetical protein